MFSLRADRAVTLGLVHPLRSILRSQDCARLPILMYHSVGEPLSTKGHPYFATETAPQQFRAHMRYLKDRGYVTLSPDELIRSLFSGQSNQATGVVITFDDGYRDFYTNAFPVLQEFGLSAIVYLPTSFIGRQSRTFLGKECLTWNEIRELQRAGILFGSHTVSHTKLRYASVSNLKSELQESKNVIESELGEAITSFAYPFAFPEEDRLFKGLLRTMLEDCAYTNGMSTIIGSKHSARDKFFLKRLPVNSWDDARLFKAKLEGSYDWLYWPQYISKQLKFRAKRQRL